MEAAEQALYASKITSYAQGLNLLKMASTEYNWELDLARITPRLAGGLHHPCRAAERYLRLPTPAIRALPNLLMDKAFTKAILSRQTAWRMVVQTAVGLGIPMLATSASLAYFDAYRSAILPANLTQAQRDYSARIPIAGWIWKEHFTHIGKADPIPKKPTMNRSQELLADINSLGISIKEVTDQMEQEGVQAFADAFTVLLNAIEDRMQAAVAQ